MLPSHPRRLWRPALATAVSAAVLGAVAGCAGSPSRPAAEVTPQCGSRWHEPNRHRVPVAGRVRYWLLDNSGLDSGGCDWHFSTHDDRLIANRLSAFIGSLALGW